jgi:hypothetical protein
MHTHTPMDCETERWVVLSWHPKLCSNRTKPILLQSQQDTELGGLTDCSEHIEEFHILSGIRLDWFVLIQASGSYRSQSQRICFRAQQKKSSTFSQVCKTRWVSSHSTQWLPQKSVSEDLFQITAEEEFHILRYKTQWVSCFFPFNNLMNLIEL